MYVAYARAVRFIRADEPFLRAQINHVCRAITFHTRRMCVHRAFIVRARPGTARVCNAPAGDYLALYLPARCRPTGALAFRQCHLHFSPPVPS